MFFTNPTRKEVDLYRNQSHKHSPHCKDSFPVLFTYKPRQGKEIVKKEQTKKKGGKKKTKEEEDEEELFFCVLHV